MTPKKWLTTIDAHAGGAPVRLVTGGIPDVPGKTMTEKSDYIKHNLDYVRTSLVDEPRGHSAMWVFILTAPVTPEASFGVVMGYGRGYVGMCGHGSMGIATIAVEMGIVEPKEPVTEVVFDTPSGTIHTKVNVRQGKVGSVTLQNVPSFLYKTAFIKVLGIGEIPVDIAYGGNFWAIIKGEAVGINPNAADIAKSRDILTEIEDCVNKQVEVRHPELDFMCGVHSIILSYNATSPEANIRHISIDGDNIDRSPCGTGTSAEMAALYAKGKLKLGESYVTQSIIGSLFYGKLVEEVNVSGFQAVVPEITGQAFIIGMHNFVIDKDDIFKHGFKM